MGAKNRLTVFVCLFILAGFSSSCNNSAEIEIELRPPKKFIDHKGTFMAGAAKVDITPPPGYPMGGFAVAGKFSRGWWTRLYAKAIYLQDIDGNRIALVSCDLQSMPAGLADKVAQIVGQQIKTAHPDSAFLGREQIILVGTHTHHSPGNFFSSAGYNAIASPQSGFDKILFAFLASRIARAIYHAVSAREPAVLKQASIQLPNLSRNRSLPAFEKNPVQERNAILSQAADSEQAQLSDLPPSVVSEVALQAVDNTLTVFEVTAKDPAKKIPIAVAAFFAAHPTVMGPETQVYSSDVFGVASTLVEQQLRRQSFDGTPVVAIFNGAEGDVSLNWTDQNRNNTLRLGNTLAEGILEGMSKAKQLTNGELSFRYRMLEIKDSKVTDLYDEADALCVSTEEMRTAKDPYPGIGTFGGAEDGRTIFYDFGLREGFTSEECDAKQGYKAFLLKEVLSKVLQIPEESIIGKLAEDIVKQALKLPTEIPLGVYSIGSTVFVTLPGEFTVALGNRIRNTIQKKTGADSVILIGLANEYLSYFTTPSEYNAQHYEGASTMYGQVAGLFIEQELGRVTEMPKNTSDFDRTKKYAAGPRVQKDFAKISAQEPWPLLEGLQTLLQDTTGGKVYRNFPQFPWWEEPIVLSSMEADSDGAWPGFHPSVSIQRKEAGGWKPLAISSDLYKGNGGVGVVETDTLSLNFVTVVDSVAKDSERWRWRTIWLVPDGVDRKETVRFAVQTAQDEPIHSKEFVIEAILSGKDSPVIPKRNE
ncbi:hypothetical protein GWO43_12985 [candidate division KSB1 bacterium]|nr:hypothetical protein [candidate division KSB1 bacterium]NIR71524.1 hypothetical protein [candidate division KSB1 bacterium]NIS24872.1 hypothetical protein [candidate division KSB1 bacterium]NIT71772.1 hypothetical protein [candidate division KSB1 bacterium]NIU25508.1 hypothetical protein [candidate division KSB1 bacterium]